MEYYHYFWYFVLNTMNFSSKILAWYGKNQRDLPWRKTLDAYKIWLSEVILQQTKVAQGTPYYLRFVERFRNIDELSMASEEEVLKLWQGLGYYSRARYMHHTARYISEKLDGKFPDKYEDLIQLKGIGDYTASAIASICFNEPRAVVDGNVYRVLSRYFGIDLPIDTSKGMIYFKKLATELIDADNIRDYNQAVMEFGAIQCVPKNPNCFSCPLQDSCIAKRDAKVDKLPIKQGKTKVTKRYFNYLVLQDGKGATLMHKRNAKDIWRNLWEFPLLETEKTVGASELRRLAVKQFSWSKEASIEAVNQSPVVHKLSHQQLHTIFWKVSTRNLVPGAVSWKKIKDYPIPILLADYIDTLKKNRIFEH